VRPVSSELFSYPSDADEKPLSTAVVNIDAQKLAAGEAEFTMDYTMRPGSLFGALAITTQATGTITAVDVTAAAGERTSCPLVPSARVV
jgi:xanthine dehydrogenase molybdopterin-binding subunit B